MLTLTVSSLAAHSSATDRIRSRSFFVEAVGIKCALTLCVGDPLRRQRTGLRGATGMWINTLRCAGQRSSGLGVGSFKAES